MATNLANSALKSIPTTTIVRKVDDQWNASRWVGVVDSNIAKLAESGCQGMLSSREMVDSLPPSATLTRSRSTSREGETRSSTITVLASSSRSATIMPSSVTVPVLQTETASTLPVPIPTLAPPPPPPVTPSAPPSAPSRTPVPAIVNMTTTPEPSNETSVHLVVEELSETEKVTARVVATTAATVGTVAAVGGGGGGGSATDIQTLLVIGLTSCASDTMRSVSEASRETLYPFGDAIGDFEASTLVGSLAAVFLFGSLHMLAALFHLRCKKKRRGFAHSLAVMKCPSLTIFASNFLYQGIVLEASLLLFRKTEGNQRSNETRIVSGSTLFACMAVPVVYALWTRANVPNFHFSRYDHSKRNRFLSLFVYPTGLWDAKNPKVKQFKSVFGMLDGNRFWALTVASHMRSFLVAIIAANQDMSCTTQAVLLCAVFWVYALVLVVVRPLRLQAANFFTPVVSLLSGALCLAVLAPSLTSKSGTLLVATSGLTVVGTVVQMSAIVGEKVWKFKKTAVFEAEEESNISSSSSESAPEVESDDDDTEMAALAVPLYNGSTTKTAAASNPLASSSGTKEVFTGSSSSDDE